MKIQFTLDESAFAFQADNRFFLKNIAAIARKIASKDILCSKTIEMVNGLPPSSEESIFIDARIFSSSSELLLNAIKKQICLVSEYDDKILFFENASIEVVSLKDSYFNPQNIYVELLKINKPYISPTAKIMPGAYITGNSYIGDNCIVGHNALVRDSYIDEGAVVGYNTEVNKSYLGRKSTLHTNFIGHSIVGDDCHFGYISCTTVVRLDGINITLKAIEITHSSKELKMGAFIEYGCQIGAYVALMPGVMIGMKSIIFPYTKINIAIPRQSYCKLSHQLEVDKLKEVPETSNYDIYEKQLLDEITKVDQSENK